MYISLGDDDGDQKMALKLLFQLLCVAKKGENCLNYLFAQHRVGHVCHVKCNQYYFCCPNNYADFRCTGDYSIVGS